MNDEIMRILIATDNHLGYLEKDSIRGDDSYASFEEVLITAKRLKVDMLLFAGDMFHENKPSRHAMHSTMELLRQYCLGDDAIYTEILSDQREIFKSSHGLVNYENPYQAISLPIYAIHGNHDDPSRECGQNSDALCALDLLAVSNLLNYFGKVDQVDNVEITPILIRKGNTHIALYGLGAVRDERLNRMWNLKKVKFIRPSIEQGRDKFFNIFLLHQNRDYGRGSKNCIHESMIPEWMDLVIWGNEHEAIPKVVESLVGTFRIYQPGSTVCTSLVEGESSSHPKGMGLVEVRSTKEFRMKFHPLKQIRPFIFREVALKDYPTTVLRSTDLNIEEKIQKVLQQVVEEMIQEAHVLADQVEAAAVVPKEASGKGPRFRVKSPDQVLVRLRVDPSGFPTIHPQRFGALFVGRVANPHDILIFARKKREELDRIRGAVGKDDDIVARMIEDGQDDIHKIRIEDLVNETLATSNKHLSLLPDSEMAQALEDFVIRRFPNAIVDTVEEALEHIQKELFEDVAMQNMMGDAIGPDATQRNKSVITEATAKLRQQAEEKVKKGQPAFAGAIPKRRTSTAVVERDSDDDQHLDDDAEGSAGDEAVPTGKAGRGSSRGGRGGRGTAGRGGKSGTLASASTNDAAVSSKPTTARGGASSGGRGSRGGRSAGGKSATAKSSRAAIDDELDEVNNEDDDAALCKVDSRKTTKRTTARKQATGRASKRKADFSDEDEVDDEIVDSEEESDYRSPSEASDVSTKPKVKSTARTVTSSTRLPPAKKVINETAMGGRNSRVVDMIDDDDVVEVDKSSLNSTSMTLSQANRLAQSKLKFATSQQSVATSFSSSPAVLTASSQAPNANKLTQSKKASLMSGW